MSAFGLRGNGARTLWRNFVWLPPVLVFYQYFYHLRIISGRSMQVSQSTSVYGYDITCYMLSNTADSESRTLTMERRCYFQPFRSVRCRAWGYCSLEVRSTLVKVLGIHSESRNFYFRSPQDPRRILIKRVIAIEGDTIQTLPPYPDAFVTIPNGHVWVEGKRFFAPSLQSSHGFYQEMKRSIASTVSDSVALVQTELFSNHVHRQSFRACEHFQAIPSCSALT